MQGGELKRAVILVADSLGVGEAPDAALYGDSGSNTLGHTAAAVGGLRLPTLEKLGLGALGDFEGIPRVAAPAGRVGRLAERSVGKDTTTGHWELAGVVTREPFAVFPDGFPPDLVASFVREAGLPGVLGNRPASGTAIIDELGEESLRTGKPILYTSADSVFQVAAHEDSRHFGLERLYRVCEVARRLTRPHRIGRVIARPFVGEKRGGFKRTERRRDYSMEPPRNCLDVLSEAGVETISVGKIDDIFCHRGLSAGKHTGNNADSLRAAEDFLEKTRGRRALVFVNLVDFDMLYGHRRDPVGYARALSEMDAFLPRLIGKLEPGDCLMLTGDHGCDPTFRGSDHTREYVPLVAYSPGVPGGVLGDLPSFTEVAATMLHGYGLDGKLSGLGDGILCAPGR